jgi:hypothetical protein
VVIISRSRIPSLERPEERRAVRRPKFCHLCRIKVLGTCRIELVFAVRSLTPDFRPLRHVQSKVEGVALIGLVIRTDADAFEHLRTGEIDNQIFSNTKCVVIDYGIGKRESAQSFGHQTLRCYKSAFCVFTDRPKTYRLVFFPEQVAESEPVIGILRDVWIEGME